MGIVILLAFPGGCPWEWPNQDDWYDDDDSDGGDDGDEGTTTTPEACTWDVDNLSFPIDVYYGQAVIGEIAFDGNCDLIVGAGEELVANEALYRVKSDGSVSVLVEVEELPDSRLNIMGMTHRPSDNRIYFLVGIEDSPDWLYAVDEQGVVDPILDVEGWLWSLTVAPASFGEFGDQLIAVQYSPSALVAIDVENLTITPFAATDLTPTIVEFGNDGTLYMAEFFSGRISTVTPEGEVTPFYTGLPYLQGMAISPDGTRMFVAHGHLHRYIDEISIPDAVLTSTGISYATEGSAPPNGMIVDGADHVLYMMTSGNRGVLDMFPAP